MRLTSIWKVRMTSDLESWVRWGSSVSSPRLRELCDLLSIELRLLKCTAMSRPWAAANTDIIVQLQAEECVMYKKRESERNTVSPVGLEVPPTRARVFSPTYPTWALVGGTSRPAGETVMVVLIVTKSLLIDM